jgi:hypothetical protein
MVHLTTFLSRIWQSFLCFCVGDAKIRLLSSSQAWLLKTRPHCFGLSICLGVDVTIHQVVYVLSNWVT